MALSTALFLAAVLCQLRILTDPLRDVATAEKMWQREEHLREERTQLLRELEESRSTVGDRLFSVLELWMLLLAAVVLLLLAVSYCVTRKRKLVLVSISEQDSCSHNKEEDDEEEKDLRGASGGTESLIVYTLRPTQDLPDTSECLKEPDGDLLDVHWVLSRMASMLQMHPVAGMDGACEIWSTPPEHSFSLEPDTMGQLPARSSSVPMLLESVCSREQLPWGSHHPDDDLSGDESSALPRALCIRSSLDLEKFTCCFRGSMSSAWLLLHLSEHWCLSVLPSFQCCRFQLINTSNMGFCMLMTLGVQRGSSGTSA